MLCTAGGAHHAAVAVGRRVGRLHEVEVGGPHARVERLGGVEEEGDLRRRCRRLKRRHHDLPASQLLVTGRFKRCPAGRTLDYSLWRLRSVQVVDTGTPRALLHVVGGRPWQRWQMCMVERTFRKHKAVCIASRAPVCHW